MEKKKEVVRKSNVFIDGRYRFGLHEQKLLLLVVAQVRTDQKEFTPYQVPWSEIKRVSKNKLNTVAKINQACENLKSKTISISSHGGRVVNNFGFLSGWTTHQGKYVEFRIDPGMKEMLLGLLRSGNFTIYDLECALSLPSPHAIRLYEVLKSHIWKKQPVIITLKNLKHFLDIPLNSKTYSDFGNFRQFILNRAQKNLLKYTDIKFTYKTIKEGRKVASIAFKITDNKKYQRTIQASASRDYVRPGDIILVAGKEVEVGQSGYQYHEMGKYQTIPIGALTTMLKKGTIEIIQEVRK